MSPDLGVPRVAFVGALEYDAAVLGRFRAGAAGHTIPPALRRSPLKDDIKRFTRIRLYAKDQELAETIRPPWPMMVCAGAERP
jgi:hypothetical protein